MASYKAKGQCNIVGRNQVWQNSRTGKPWRISQRGNRGKEWILSNGKDNHHINEGTLLKFFKRLA